MHSVDRLLPFRTLLPLLLLSSLIACANLFAQNQGTYLFVEFSEEERAGSLDSLTVVRVEAVEGADDPSFFGEEEKGSDEEREVAVSGSFGTSAFEFPSEKSEEEEEKKLFDEDAYLNPSFGEEPEIGLSEETGTGFESDSGFGW